MTHLPGRPPWRRCRRPWPAGHRWWAGRGWPAAAAPHPPPPPAPPHRPRSQGSRLASASLHNPATGAQNTEEAYISDLLTLRVLNVSVLNCCDDCWSPFSSLSERQEKFSRLRENFRPNTAEDFSFSSSPSSSVKLSNLPHNKIVLLAHRAQLKDILTIPAKSALLQ